MIKFYIFMILLASCLSYYYNARPHYLPRYATSLSRLPAHFRNKLPFGKPQYRNHGLQTQLYRRRQDYRPGPTRVMHEALRTRWVTPKHPNSSLSIFGFVKNTMQGATLATEEKFPWIARVVASDSDPSPTVCTATCIEERIFITPAICIYRVLFRLPRFCSASEMFADAAVDDFYAIIRKKSASIIRRMRGSGNRILRMIADRLDSAVLVRFIDLHVSIKLVYSRVQYQGEKLKPIAFVLPSKPTKQMFFDIGIIVVDRKFTKEWKTLDTKNVTWADNEYKWIPEAFDELIYGTVIGYVDGPEPEYFRRSVSEDDEDKKNENPLYSLDVTVSNSFCNYAYSNNMPNDAYFLPCYVTCYPKERAQNLSKCYKILAGMGHPVKDYFKSNLIGITSWGGYIKDGFPPLPIGLAVPGSPSYKEDLACAQKIKAAETNQTLKNLCN